MRAHGALRTLRRRYGSSVPYLLVAEGVGEADALADGVVGGFFGPLAFGAGVAGEDGEDGEDGEAAPFVVVGAGEAVGTGDVPVALCAVLGLADGLEPTRGSASTDMVGVPVEPAPVPSAEGDGVPSFELVIGTASTTTGGRDG